MTLKWQIPTIQTHQVIDNIKIITNRRATTGGSWEVAKTFLIDLPVMILFGALFALFASADTDRPFYRDPAFWHGMVFTSIFNVAVVYALVLYPDWMWMYYLEQSQNSPGELLYLFIFLYYLPYLLGFYLGRDLKRKSLWSCLGLVALMAATEGWLIWRLFDRYAVIGTREQFLTGTAISLFGPDNPIALVMNGSVGGMVVYFLWVFFLYRKQKRS